MNIISSYKQVMYGAKFPISVINGTPPYTFEVLTTGLNISGGSIDSNGIYTASNKNGVDTIQVTDSLLEVAQFKVQVGSYLNALVDIIKTVLNLAPDQVMIYNQKFQPPKDSRAYISIKEVYSTVVGKSRSNTSAGAIFNAKQELFMRSNVDVSFYTRDLNVFELRHQVNMALSSNYSERQQELNGFKIGLNPTNVANYFDTDGAAIPYFSNLNYNIQYKVTSIEDVPYFEGIAIDGVTTNS